MRKDSFEINTDSASSLAIPSAPPTSSLNNAPRHDEKQQAAPELNIQLKVKDLEDWGQIPYNLQELDKGIQKWIKHYFAQAVTAIRNYDLIELSYLLGPKIYSQQLFYEQQLDVVNTVYSRAILTISFYQHVQNIMSIWNEIFEQPDGKINYANMLFHGAVIQAYERAQLNITPSQLDPQLFLHLKKQYKFFSKQHFNHPKQYLASMNQTVRQGISYITLVEECVMALQKIDKLPQLELELRHYKNELLHVELIKQVNQELSMVIKKLLVEMALQNNAKLKMLQANLGLSLEMLDERYNQPLLKFFEKYLNKLTVDILRHLELDHPQLILPSISHYLLRNLKRMLSVLQLDEEKLKTANLTECMQLVLKKQLLTQQILYNKFQIMVANAKNKFYAKFNRMEKEDIGNSGVGCIALDTIRDEDGNSLMHYACLQLKILCDQIKKDPQNEFLTHQYEKLRIIMLELLNRGATFTVRNKQQQLPLFCSDDLSLAHPDDDLQKYVRFGFINWAMLVQMVKQIRCHSYFMLVVQKLLLKYSEDAAVVLANHFKGWFYKKFTGKNNLSLQLVFLLAKAMYRSQAEMSDQILLDAILSLRIHAHPRSKLFKSLMNLIHFVWEKKLDAVYFPMSQETTLIQLREYHRLHQALQSAQGAAKEQKEGEVAKQTGVGNGFRLFQNSLEVEIEPGAPEPSVDYLEYQKPEKHEVSFGCVIC